MEHREAPRIAQAEPAVGPRAARRRGRSLPWPRLGLAVLAAATLGLLAVAGSRLGATLIAYLHGRPQYRISFREIALDPPPPPWFRGGAEVFLERVRANAGEPEDLSVLDLDLKQLTRDFKQFCWVKRVARVERSYPRRAQAPRRAGSQGPAEAPARGVVVHLDYNRPVACARSRDRPGQITVDEEGVILPHDDIDRQAAGPLVPLWDLDPPAEPQPGRRWKAPGPAQGTLQDDASTLAAARLAGFLKGRSERDAKDTAILLNPEKELFLQLQQHRKLAVHWGHAPGAEGPGEPSAQAKWTMILDWLAKHDPKSVQLPKFFLVFSPTGLVPYESHATAPAAGP